MKSWLQNWRIRLSLGVAATVLLICLDTWLSTAPMAPEQVNRIVVMMHGVNPLRPPADVGWAWLDGWRNHLGVRHGLNASYRCVSNRILVPRSLEPIACDPVMIPTYAHELVHAAQRRRMGLLGYMLAKIFQRGRIEYEAQAEEYRALEALSKEAAPWIATP